ncbi:DUF4435 domain-containing protein [Candidatus Thiodictyon syntrophicum]|jgi:hypothetical protein|uniref:DUF4435 domain-containing protein n=1 Tax=Candidatus Thiodictyon syntrophicum TaxID=1166950 RepID=A0A2K8U940_9GAMM|nr:DUF4435 domain-containing protein [Candidatus Thiodictyon syntrophicum]AUB81929.1 hypothetical protein THSYN_13815 [Candidatus Thiodictyon syntrophicum]
MTLIDYKDAGVVATEVIMTRQLHAGSFLIVEGEDDHKFWSPRVLPGHCELVIGNGKPNVEGALARLDRDHFRGALGVVDDDFDGLEGRPRPSPNLIGTDTHDLECMLIRSPALERVLAELAAPAKIRDLEARQGHSVRDALLERGLEFGRLRWVAQRRAWEIPFHKLGPERFLNRDTWLVSRDDFHDAAVRTGAVPSIDDLHAELEALPAADPWSICQGHDLVSILRIGLTRVLGSLKASKGVDDIAAMLRSAFDDQQLHGGHLGAAIRGWEQANKPYLVL